jgi:hypothetical protein
MKKHLTFSLALLTIACATMNAQLPSYLPADGLVGWWPFNGNANDESGNGNDGVVNGATLTEDRFGNLNRAFVFDGADDYIRVTEFNDQATNSLSISIWVKAVPLNTYQVFLSKGPKAPGHYEVYAFITTNKLSWNTFDACENLESDFVIADNEVHHIVIVQDANVITFYVDNIQRSQLVCEGNIQDVVNDLTFGKVDDADPYFTQGLLDDIAIYNRALTPQEIQNLYAATNETVDTGDGAAPLPQGIPYQAAARDAQGQVIADAPVNVRFSLREGAVDGAVSYSETHALTTNSIGLFNTVFGNGAPEQSAFDSINWAATTKFLQVEIDLGDGYVDMGTTQLLSVPYAFRSDEAARIKNAGLPIFADNAAALAGGLVAGEMYRTASGDLKIVY